MTNNTLADRLRSTMAQKNISQEELANSVGVSQASISKLYRGDAKSSRFMSAIAKELGVSEQWLLFGDESNVEIIGSARVWDDSTPQPNDMIAVPFYKEVSLSAGNGGCIIEENPNGRFLWFGRRFFDRKCADPKDVACLTITGDSMEPKFESGGVVAIDKGNTRIIDGDIYAINYLDHLYFKRVSNLSPLTLLLKSDNPSYPAIEARTEDVIILGKVINYSKEI